MKTKQEKRDRMRAYNAKKRLAAALTGQKVSGEQVVTAWGAATGRSTLVLRIGNIYGPGSAWFLQPALLALLGATPIRHAWPLLGGRRFQPLYVDDLIDGLTRAVGRRLTGLYNITGEEPVTITHEDGNGPLYPFSLAEKVARITEPHPWYTPNGGRASPWGRAIVPFEMVSVLTNKAGRSFPVRTPSLGLFLDLEIELVDGPVFAGQPYRVHREVVGLSQSRRTESTWTRTTMTDVDTGKVAAVALLHSGVFKASYPGYPQDRLAT